MLVIAVGGDDVGRGGGDTSPTLGLAVVLPPSGLFGGSLGCSGTRLDAAAGGEDREQKLIYSSSLYLYARMVAGKKLGFT